jgi:hypothetical protein
MRHGFPACSVAVVIALFGSGIGPASGADCLLPFRNLHTSDAEAASAVIRCYEHSPTCHRIIDDIESTSTVLLIRHGECQPGKGGSCLQFARTLPDARYLHVVLDRNLYGQALLSVTAHELQHALEVVRAPEVVDVHSFRSLYKRIGFLRSASREHEDWETEEAQRIARVVSKEVSQSKRAVAPAYE